MTQQEPESIFNTEKESEGSIKWVLEKAQDLFKDNKDLILKERLFCPLRCLQALTMTIVLPSYLELVDTLSSMAIIFGFHNKPIAQKECERLITYLVFYRKEEKHDPTTN